MSTILDDIFLSPINISGQGSHYNLAQGHPKNCLKISRISQDGSSIHGGHDYGKDS